MAVQSTLRDIRSVLNEVFEADKLWPRACQAWTGAIDAETVSANAGRSRPRLRRRPCALNRQW